MSLLELIQDLTLKLGEIFHLGNIVRLEREVTLEGRCVNLMKTYIIK